MSVACSAGKCWQPQDARWGQRPKAHSPGVGGRRLISAPSILTAEVGGQSWPCYSPRGGPGRARTDAQEAAVGASPPSGRILSFPWGTRRQALGAGAPILEGSWGCLGVHVRSRWLSSGPRAPAGTVGMQKALLGAAAARGPCRLEAALHSRTAGDSNHRHFFSLEKVIGSAWSVAPLGCPGSRPSSLTQWNYQASDLWTEPETGAPWQWTQPQASCPAGPGCSPARGAGGKISAGFLYQAWNSRGISLSVSPLVRMWFPWLSSLLRGKGTSLGSLDFVDKICSVVYISFGSVCVKFPKM
ncbi:unnamed protein product [Nyctereutes procyonoides]|uniref:(raccoon dog) hypothetical protein n=1 Tax=Nyctereutes procyonoides TaxID=34880 RepID=A0A811Z7F6_NYCPR|nr:unnamed protein product [Nyctereutes procyonoides]